MLFRNRSSCIVAVNASAVAFCPLLKFSSVQKIFISIYLTCSSQWPLCKMCHMAQNNFAPTPRNIQKLGDTPKGITSRVQVQTINSTPSAFKGDKAMKLSQDTAAVLDHRMTEESHGPVHGCPFLARLYDAIVLCTHISKALYTQLTV